MDEIAVAQRADLLRTAAKLSGDKRERFIAEHPELYAEQYFDVLRESGDARVRALIDEIAGQVGRWSRHEEPASISYGPYERLWVEVVDHTLDQRSAERLAAEAWAAAEADVYLRALGSMSRQLRLPSALSLLSIVRAGTAARPGGVFADEGGPDIELRYVRCAARYLHDAADGRLARAALATGEAVLAHAVAVGDTQLEVDALGALALVCFHPYAGGRISTNLELELVQWQRRFQEEHRYELVGTPADEWVMPEAKESLLRAAKYSERQAELVSGHERGIALNLAMQGRLLAKTLGAPLDRAKAAEQGHEAARLIDPRLAPGELVGLLSNLTTMGEAVELAVVDELLSLSLDGMAHTHGLDATLEFAFGAVMLLKSVAPHRAEAAAERARPLVELVDTGYARSRQLSNELGAFVMANTADENDETSSGPMLPRWRDLNARADNEDWDPLRHAAELVRLAGLSQQTDDEAIGLTMLDQVEQIAPVWSAGHRDPLDYRRALLYLGLGSNAYHAEDWATAISAYGTALRLLHQLDIPDAAMDGLARIDDLVLDSGHDGAVNAIGAVAGLSVPMENLGGNQATQYLQRICRHVVAGLAAGPEGQATNPVALLFALQVAKGLRFAALLLSRSRFRWQEDEHGLTLLKQLAEAERELPNGGEPEPADPSQPVDENMLMAAYASTDVRTRDDTDAGRVAALRRAYHDHLSRRLLADTRSDDVVLLGSDELHQSLDDRTVLIDLYVGMSQDGRLAVYAVAVTNTDLYLSVAIEDFPASELQLGDERVSVRASPLSLVVSGLRRDLLEPSDPDDVSEETRSSLASLLDNHLHGVAQRLDQWRAAGKDHLCFVPHESLHLAPLHLMQHGGRPLAEAWTVTVLPNHALLLDVRGGATTSTRRHVPITAIGMTYQGANPYGLVALPDAADEARAVAGVLGGRVLVDDDATEERFLEALTTSRYVHVAAHGRYDVESPSFHCLYLAPGAGSDGRLRAHELTSLDLRGTELVTLSACETSMGGSDTADNPSGLPAALFLAGVRSIIGTLWEVRSDTSAFFFQALYEELAARRPRHYAFSAAQRRTRERYPIYRDWGAFCFLGGTD